MSYSKQNFHKPSPEPFDPTAQAKKMQSFFSSLNKHKHIHSGKRPFLCEVCGKTYITKGDMNRHLKGHTRQLFFECKICNIGYSRKVNFEKHVKTKHKKNSNENLRDHIIIHEEDDESYSFAKLSQDFLVTHDTSYENDAPSGASTIFPMTPPLPSMMSTKN